MNQMNRLLAVFRFRKNEQDRQTMQAGLKAFSPPDHIQTRVDARLELMRNPSSRSLRPVREAAGAAASLAASPFERWLARLDRKYPVWNPMDPLPLAWQGLMVATVLVALVLMPYQLCIPYFGVQFGPWHPMEMLSLHLDFLLTADILVTFNVALLPSDAHTELLTTDRKTIISRYVWSWFVPDLLSSFPFGFAAHVGAAKGCENPNLKGSYFGRFPLVLADFWTSDHLSERSRSVHVFCGTCAREEHPR